MDRGIASMAVPTTEPTVVQLLACHWFANPQASDTADGMLRWWLPESEGVTLTQVTAGLAWLVEQGLIETKTSRDGRVRYRRNPAAKQAEFARLASPPTRTIRAPGGTPGGE